MKTHCHTIANLLSEVQLAIKNFENAFNASNAFGCAVSYEPTAVLNSTSWGLINGADQIALIWSRLIQDGFADLNHYSQQIQVLSETTALHTGRWKMNKASGITQRELWVRQFDGSLRIREQSLEIRPQ